MAQTPRGNPESWSAMNDLMKHLIDTDEATRRLGVTQRQVGHLLRTGKIVGKQFGRTWVIYAPSLDSYLSTKEPRGRPPSRARRRTKVLS